MNLDRRVLALIVTCLAPLACQPLPDDPAALDAEELAAITAPCAGADCPSDQDEKRGSAHVGALADTAANAEAAAKIKAKDKAEANGKARLRALACKAGCKKVGAPVITTTEQHMGCLSGTNTSSAAGWTKACRLQGAPAGVSCDAPGSAAAGVQGWAICDAVYLVKAVQACAKETCTCAELGFEGDQMCTTLLGEAPPDER